MSAIIRPYPRRYKLILKLKQIKGMIMSRILPVELYKTDPTTAKMLDAVKAKLGMLPNIFTTFALSPASLNGYLELSSALARGALTDKQRELIAITVAQENSCEYCLSAHAAIGKGVGLGDVEIENARIGKSEDPIDAAIIEFSLNVVRSKGGVSDDNLEAIRKVCKDDGMIIEIVTNVVLNILTNFVNRLAGTEVDFPVFKVSTAA